MGDNRYNAHWRSKYYGETNPVTRNLEISEDDRMALAVRRRIEDIKEASRLEREALYEVWEQ